MYEDNWRFIANKSSAENWTANVLLLKKSDKLIELIKYWINAKKLNFHPFNYKCYNQVVETTQAKLFEDGKFIYDIWYQ